jgi:hypothetical protein
VRFFWRVFPWGVLSSYAQKIAGLYYLKIQLNWLSRIAGISSSCLDLQYSSKCLSFTNFLYGLKEARFERYQPDG